MAGLKRNIGSAIRAAAAAVFVCTLLGPDFARSQSNFYEGKTLVLIQGRRPGGLGDLRTRAVMSMLSKTIPGNPAIITKYLPGGGRNTANHLYRSVRPDGLTLANIGSGFVTNGIMGARGVQYDVDKFIYLGSGNSSTNYVFLTRSEAGFDTLEKLTTTPGVRIGTLSIGHEIYVVGRLFSWILGLKEPRFVAGYSGPELDIAVKRGEVDGRANNPASVLARSPEWVTEKKAHFHAALEIPKGYRFSEPPFDKLPSLESFTRSDDERQVLQIQRTFRLVGSPYILPPGVPEERAEILRQAFRDVYGHPEFAKIWVKYTGEEASPLLPEEQTKAIREIPRSAEVLALMKTIAGARPLPERK